MAELKAANPGAYELDYAKASMRLINLYRRLKWFDDAERLCAESEQILCRCAEFSFEVYGRHLGDLYHQWADVCTASNQFEKAETLYEKALSIYMRLAEIKPGVYDTKVGWIGEDLEKLKRKMAASEDS